MNECPFCHRGELEKDEKRRRFRCPNCNRVYSFCGDCNGSGLGDYPYECHSCNGSGAKLA